MTVRISPFRRVVEVGWGGISFTVTGVKTNLGIGTPRVGGACGDIDTETTNPGGSVSMLSTQRAGISFSDVLGTLTGVDSGVSIDLASLGVFCSTPDSLVLWPTPSGGYAFLRRHAGGTSVLLGGVWWFLTDDAISVTQLAYLGAVPGWIPGERVRVSLP